MARGAPSLSRSLLPWAPGWCGYKWSGQGVTPLLWVITAQNQPGQQPAQVLTSWHDVGSQVGGQGQEKQPGLLTRSPVLCDQENRLQCTLAPPLPGDEVLSTSRCLRVFMYRDETAGYHLVLHPPICRGATAWVPVGPRRWGDSVREAMGRAQCLAQRERSEWKSGQLPGGGHCALRSGDQRHIRERMGDGTMSVALTPAQ